MYSYREIREPGPGVRCGDLPGQQLCGLRVPLGLTGPARQTAEGSGSGGVALCAAPDGSGARFALLRGAALPDAGAPTRERAREILEFPG